MFFVRNDYDDHPKKIDGIYFLENVPIQTFYIESIPDELNETNLNDYFSKFGEIDSLFIRRKILGRKCNRYGLMTFVSPQFATRLIELGQSHIVCKQIVSLKVAKVSDQPDWKEPENKQVSKITLLDLSDDCLLHILSYLPIEDQVSFSFICERFRSVCQVVFKRTKRLNLTDSMCALKIDKLLSAIGIYIKEIEYKSVNSRESHISTLNSIWEKCKNIETLHLIDLCEPTYDYSKMFFELKNLKSLSLINCNINDNTCKMLQKCNKIESLKLSYNAISGAYLDKLSNLKRLNVSYTNIDLEYLILICQNVKLKELNILGCYNIHGDDIEELFINLTDLENLKISNFLSLGSVTNELIKLKSLKHLKVYCCGYGDDDHLGDIKKLECLHLEHFTLCYCKFDIKRKNDIMFLKHLNCLSIPKATGIDGCFLTDLAKAAPIRKLGLAYAGTITSKGLINFIEKCPTIEEIDISYVKFVDNDFVLNIIDKMLEIKQIKPLKLISEKNFSSIKHEEKYVQNRNLVKLCNNKKNGYSTSTSSADLGFENDSDSEFLYDYGAAEFYFNDGMDYLDYDNSSDDS